jgi:molybdopterin-guanine dinucleotide biosynthesis protein
MIPLAQKASLIFDSSTINTSACDIKWSWACRILENGSYKLDENSLTVEPRVGDIALVKVDRVGYHSSLVTANNRKLRIYQGDLIVGVFGNRYATDALEAEVLGLQDLSILTAGGMIGTVKSKHNDFGRPTGVTFVGFLKNEKGKRVNLKEFGFRASQPKGVLKNIIMVVGTGMNAGKTTTARILVKSLSDRGFKVAACKLTGSVSNRDQDELRSAFARSIVDFSDYGFPSTYLCTREELLSLFNTMISDLEKTSPDMVIMEIADGILQRETAILLKAAQEEHSIKSMIKGVILAADSASAALYAVEKLEGWGHKIIAISGSITSSPLFVREFIENSNIPVCSSVDTGEELADTVTHFTENNE